MEVKRNEDRTEKEKIQKYAIERISLSLDQVFCQESKMRRFLSRI